MKITFKTSDDKTKCEIYLNGMYLGTVHLNVWSQKWTMKPVFELPYGDGTIYQNFDSSYKAGKEMVELYNFLYPTKEGKQEFGFSLKDVLSFLKIRD